MTDPARFPKALKEAPQLAALVKAGKLPAVAERVGQDPLVIKPLHEIGTYGGTSRGGFTGPADFWNGYRERRQRRVTPARAQSSSCCAVPPPTPHAPSTTPLRTIGTAP